MLTVTRFRWPPFPEGNRRQTDISEEAEDRPCERFGVNKWREGAMTTAALLLLVLSSIALCTASHSPEGASQGSSLGWLFTLFWFGIAFESVIGYWQRGDFSLPALGRLLLLLLIPPYRLAVSTYPAGSCVWLSVLGWQHDDPNNLERAERAFSIPMLLIALLILPILVIELFWAKYVTEYAGLQLTLDVATAVIWLGFTVEFIVMSSIAEKKLLYVLKHWLNLAIILLPFLAFLRGLTFARVLRLGNATNMLKVYRLRGLAMRAWHGLVVLDILERLIHRRPEARLQSMRERAREVERELQKLNTRIGELANAIDGTAE